MKIKAPYFFSESTRAAVTIWSISWCSALLEKKTNERNVRICMRSRRSSGAKITTMLMSQTLLKKLIKVARALKFAQPATKEAATRIRRPIMICIARVSLILRYIP